MDLNSTYKDRPTLLWIAVLIVAAVGVWLLIQGVLLLGTDFGLSAMDGYEEWMDDFVDIIATIAGGIYIFFGLFTLLLAFLIYSGSRGGKTVLTIILIISILVGAMNLIFGVYLSIIEFILALIVLIILYQPAVKAYFGR